jgi:sugar phosphate isomerase/epimerase
MKRLFRLGTTSFIYPDHILPNVRKIGRYFDEIELLVFESMPDTVLPSKKEIAELADLSTDLDLMYNIHLPTDVYLAHDSKHLRQQAADTIARVVDLCAPLAPTTHTLHLETGDQSNPGGTAVWQAQALDGLDRLMPFLPDPRAISVETLDYPPACLEPLQRAHGFQICMDIGHHLKYGYDLEHSFSLFSDHLPVMHLHGVAGAPKDARDHVGLDCLAQDQQHQILALLKKYHGCVSLEVFNRRDLNGSLAVLSAMFDNIPSPLPA